MNDITEAPEKTVVKKPKTKASDKAAPNDYHAMLHNDEFTHAHWVAEMLSDVFGLSKQAGMQVMLHAHKHGEAIVGTYSKDIAETKCDEAMQFASKNEFPLRMTAEEV